VNIQLYADKDEKVRGWEPLDNPNLKSIIKSKEATRLDSRFKTAMHQFCGQWHVTEHEVNYIW